MLATFSIWTMSYLQERDTYTVGKTEDVAIFAFSFIQSKGVRLVVVAIGPDAQKQRYRNVLNEIGGNELIFVGDYEGIGAVVTDITDMICRKYLITTK